MNPIQKILVVGATGGSGRAAVEQLLRAGHQVTAFSRSATAKLAGLSDRLTTIDGDAMNPADIDSAVQGHDAVVVTLGITENPLRVRFLGAARTATDVRSAGTRNVIEAMERHGVRRLVVQSSYGVGTTRGRLRTIDSLFFRLLLKPQIDDTEAQERIVRDSELEWVLVQPVHLTDDAEDEMPYFSTEGDVEGWKVSRKSVGRFLGEAALSADYLGDSVALSGRGAA